MIVMKLIRESLIFAYHALVINKLRTFLSLLGITIGIFLIISVFTMVDSLEQNIRSSVASLGDDVIFIEKWPWNSDGDYPWWKYWQRPEPGLGDLRELQSRWPAGASAMCLVVYGDRKVEHKSVALTGIKIHAVSEGYDRVKSLSLERGRVISGNEYQSARPVGMIGHEVAMNLFGTADCTGKEFKIGGRKIQVVGVFTREGSSIIGNSLDNVVVLPVTFGRALINISEAESAIMVKARPGVTNDELKDELMGVMRAIRRLRPREEADFALNEASVINSQLDGLFSIINIAGMVIGLFSIVVGGFSIANIMFVSVKERTNLIGIQKSLGAKNYFILFQFLFEAVFLCLVGGILGLIIVSLGALFFSLLLDISIVLTLENILIGIVVSLGIGLISGVVPAMVAARLDPVEAIRSN